MRSIFGWSYPPGCSGPPEYPEYQPLRCKHCKSFIGGKPVRRERWEQSLDCGGSTTNSEGDSGCGIFGTHPPHKVIYDAGTYDVYVCKRCGKETNVG